MATGRCAIRIELKNAVGVSDLKYACHRRVGARDAHPAAASLHVSAAEDQHPQSGAVDVVQPGQIDHQLAGSAVDHPVDGILGETERIAVIEAAGHLHNRHVSDLLDFGFYHVRKL